MNKYQWPADKLTEKEMEILYNWRQVTKIPINQLLAQAIVLLDKIVKPKPVMGKGGDCKMAKKQLRRVMLSISQQVIDEVMSELGYKVGSVGGGTVEYEGTTFLSDEVLIRAIAQKIADKIEIIN